MDTDKIECRTPTEGKKSTRIDRWKYDRISAAILALVPKDGDGLLFKELPDLVAEHLGPGVMKDIGSSSWYTTTVKLDLEVRGLLYRSGTSGPQRLLARS